MKRERALSIVLALTAFGFYLYGLAPTVTVGDSGEFSTAAATLGIPHPSGYPVYTLLSRALSELIPWGNPAYRTNLFSAFAGSATVALLFLFLVRRTASLPGSLTGSLFFMLSSAQMVNSRHTEVFSLNALLSLSVLTAMDRSQWALAGLLWGLGFANHQTILLLAPVLIYTLLKSPETETGNRLEHVIELAVFFLIGALSYAFLVIRSSQGPFLNVGQPADLPHLWRVITRADYGTMTLALGETPARTFANLLLQFQRFGDGMRAQVGWMGLGAGAVGVYAFWKRDRDRFWEILLGFSFMGPLFFLLGNLPFDSQSSGLLHRFYLVPTLFWCMGIAYASYAIKRGWILLFLPMLLVPQAMSSSSRNSFEAYAYGRNNLRSLPPHAILFMDGGDDTFYTLAYLTQAERRRTDLHLHDRGGIVFAHPYGADFRSLTREQKEARRQKVESALVHDRQPVYYSTMNDRLLSGTTLTQTGIVYRAAPDSSRTYPWLWSFYDLRGIAPWMTSSLQGIPEYRLRALLPYYAYQQAVLDGRHLNWSNAVLSMRSAWRQGGDVLWLKPNVIWTLHQWAYAAYQRQDRLRAKDLYSWILKIDPMDATARKNLSIMDGSIQ